MSERREIIDWDDLDIAAKSIIARQIYTDEYRNQFPYSYYRELFKLKTGHFMKTVKIDHRTAEIDAALVGLIRWLWQNDMETLASCENLLGEAIDGTPNAYILFLADEYGGELFADILTRSRIRCYRGYIVEKAFFTIEGASRLIRLRASKVEFHADDINLIYKAFADMIY